MGRKKKAKTTYRVKFSTVEGNDSVVVSVKKRSDIPRAVRAQSFHRKITIYSVARARTRK